MERILYEESMWINKRKVLQMFDDFRNIRYLYTNGYNTNFEWTTKDFTIVLISLIFHIVQKVKS